MLKIFDYLYYRTYDIYQKKWKENMPWLYAWCVVALMQVLNLMLIGLAVSTFLHIEISNGKAVIIAICTVVFGLNYVRYKKLGYDKLESRWKDEPSEKRKYKGWLIILYIIFSLPVSIWLFAELGKMNNSF